MRAGGTHGESARLSALGVYKPRRPQASPLFRLVSEHVHRRQRRRLMGAG